MFAIIDAKSFLNHLDINTIEEIDDIEYRIGPTMFELKLKELDFSFEGSETIYKTHKEFGAYEIGEDISGNIIIERFSVVELDDDEGESLF